MIWLGGGSGAGKTTVARAVAGRLDLRLYHVDFRGFDHVARMVDGTSPRTRAFNAMPYDDRWLREPAVLAEEFLAISAERMPLVLADLAALGPGATVLVEGPQLLPDLVAPLLGSTGVALWMLPTEEFARRAVAARGELVPSARQAEILENRYRRDVLVTQALRASATTLGLRWLPVDGHRSIADTVDLLAGWLQDLPCGLVRAATGEQRASIRRQENEVTARQLASYWDDVGSEAMPDAPVGPFSCECRTLGCTAEVSLPLDVYLAGRASGPWVTHLR